VTFTRIHAIPTPGRLPCLDYLAPSQVVVVLVLAAVLGVTFRWQPLSLLGSVTAEMLGSSFFASLSMTSPG
jgi:hypothetical protein